MDVDKYLKRFLAEKNANFFVGLKREVGLIIEDNKKFYFVGFAFGFVVCGFGFFVGWYSLFFIGLVLLCLPLILVLRVVYLTRKERELDKVIKKIGD